ncbi:exodeoxyribonuclease VII small subunit [Atopobacter phocae]|uniref:exodeoxyribonuclease VII small subunit n=1 Tax=Atopobacter phocae TaxID=136492 RepID=UPI000470BC01|nr:exodeoxyribonuclease VII small subunit [Atopobacter phocae]
MAQKKPKNFEAAITELEELTQKLESGTLTLEESIEAYQRGMFLGQFCNQELERAEKLLAHVIEEDGEATPLNVKEDD